MLVDMSTTRPKREAGRQLNACVWRLGEWSEKRVPGDVYENNSYWELEAKAWLNWSMREKEWGERKQGHPRKGST